MIIGHYCGSPIDKESIYESKWFWGYYVLSPDNTVRWQYNPFLQMTREEQLLDNKKNDPDFATLQAMYNVKEEYVTVIAG